MKVSKKKKITKKYNNIIKGGGNYNSSISLRPERTERTVKQSIKFKSSNTNEQRKYNINHSLQRELTPVEKFEESCNIEFNSHGYSKIKVPFYCYGKKIYEFTNQSIGVQYNENRYDYYTITPLTLSVSTMQLSVESGSLSIIEENGNYYLGFINNFPALMVQQTYNYAYTTRPLDTDENSDDINEYESKPEVKWFNVYEDKDTFIYKDKKFEIIEDYIASEKNYVIYNPDITDTTDTRNFNQRRPNLSVNKSLRPSYLQGGTLNTIRPHNQHNQSSKKKTSKSVKNKSLNTLIRKIFGNEKTIYISTDSNLKSFEYLTEQVRQIIEEIKTETNTIKIEELLFKRKLAISRVIYRTYINYNGQTGNIIENIRWVVENALWLEKYLELRKKYGEVNNLLTNLEYKELQHPMYESGFSDLDLKYLIIDDTTHPEYVICGYPERQMKAHILNFWQDTGNTTNFTTLFKKLDSDNSRLIAKLFNEFKEEKDKIKDASQYYKLYVSLRKSIFKYIEDRYTELNKEDKTKVSDVELQHFKDNFEKNANNYFQEIALKYLPKPMVFIKYVFLVFNKNKDGKLTPMVFNVKELTKHHKSILESVERLIKHELPYRFGILSDAEYKNGKGNENDPFDDEYKLWYSRYRYGKFFHISTEYLHTMSNIADKAHNYKNSITLEELIYSCGLFSNSGKPFFEDVKFEYEVREHQINNYSISQSEQLNNKTHLYLNNELKLGLRSEKVFDLYEKEKDKGNNTTTKNVNIPFKKNEIQDIKFILMFKILENKYIFIYLLNNKFYKLIIKYNIKQIVKKIIKKLKDKFTKNTISLDEPNKLLKIISNNLLSNEDYKIIFEQNPMIFKYHYKPNNDPKINALYFYLTGLLDVKHMSNYNELVMYNLYLNKTVLIINILDKFKKINENNRNTEILNENKLLYDKNDEHYWSCIKQKCNLFINYIYYDNDYKKCGYDIIETIDKNNNKIRLWLNPSVITSKYLGNFMDLDNTSLLLLNKIKKLYVNNNYMCFVHNTSNIIFYGLHFHIIKKKNYDRDYMVNNKGSYLIQDLYLENIINNITNYNNYYIESNFNIIKGY